eukprot:4974414-Amphidinium_carterae.2
MHTQTGFTATLYALLWHGIRRGDWTRWKELPLNQDLDVEASKAEMGGGGDPAEEGNDEVRT